MQAIFEVGSKLLNGAKEGDMRAIQFYLKTQAGWSERNYLELARAEPTEPSDNHWTWEVMTVAPGTIFNNAPFGLLFGQSLHAGERAFEHLSPSGDICVLRCLVRQIRHV